MLYFKKYMKVEMTRSKHQILITHTGGYVMKEKDTKTDKEMRPNKTTIILMYSNMQGKVPVNLAKVKDKLIGN